MYIHLSIYLSVCLFVYLSIYLSVDLSIYIYMYKYSIHVSINADMLCVCGAGYPNGPGIFFWEGPEPPKESAWVSLTSQ